VNTIAAPFSRKEGGNSLSQTRNKNKECAIERGKKDESTIPKTKIK
jgi:hypothetical protein